ncbi:MAG: gephyrin-like molybdotransferase Glp [Halieaceae bacterium]
MSLTPLADALEIILDSVDRVPNAEPVGLEVALNRYVAEAVVAPCAVPPADNSAMDGYAVCSTDVPGLLPVSQRIPAGQPPLALSPGTAARIFTGAEIPPGADAVIPQEDAEATAAGVRLPPVSEGQHIRRQGDDIRPGDCLVQRGQCLRPQDVGLLASVGINTVSVYRPLRVAILTTGDELRDPGKDELESGQIFNSNRFVLAHQVQALGFEVTENRHVPDVPAKIAAALRSAAASADCIVTAGGVSVGEEDHVRGEIEKQGTLAIWRLAIKPGKPLAFGEVQGTPIFGLPGNPVSAWITFALVARPWLVKRQGGMLPVVPRFPVQARFTIARPGSREEFLRVRLVGQGLEMRAELTGSQSSGVLTSLSAADGLAVLPAGATVTPGDWVEVIPLSALWQPGFG